MNINLYTIQEIIDKKYYDRYVIFTGLTHNHICSKDGKEYKFLILEFNS